MAPEAVCLAFSDSAAALAAASNVARLFLHAPYSVFNVLIDAALVAMAALSFTFSSSSAALEAVMVATASVEM